MTIPTLAFIFTLATNSESSAETWDCGEIANTVSCSLDENDVFTISGTGKMKDYQYNKTPWSSTANIQTVVVDKGVTSIGSYAFYRASKLTSITIPDSVTSIGGDAFNSASKLTSITLPDSVTRIGTGAFAWTGLTSITIPDSVKSIGEAAFTGTSSLESITLPEGLTSIGYRAFYNATGLTSITIPEGVTSIGSRAFDGAKSLTSITIPDSVTWIGERAFDGTSSLTSITIPDSVTSIGNAAFAYSGLTSITIPDSVTSIGEYAFMDAKSLTSITIPDNINTARWAANVFLYLPEGTNIVCQGGLNTCYEKLAKYFSYGDCPQNLIDAGKGNLCSCSDSRYCILPSRISEATNSSQDSSNQDKETISGDFNPADCYNNGQVPYNNQCLDEYPFAKKRWTPAEANEWLHDGNDNFVVITFKK